MVQTLEGIKGGGGSIKVGTTGTIGALMSRELDSIKPALQKPASFKKTSPSNSASIATGAATKRTLKPRPQPNEASCSGKNATGSINREIIPKAKHYNRRSNQIPMLDSENISVDGTPIRQKPDKRLSYMVEVVDIKCGKAERAWASPITNRLKKIGFSKLSESII
ncbi:OLC1v1022783C1 [Oldenlandia corymbosa var. corymbosa]|uniref:OLC1v1022783C1 n=1 Tax=Oldenlandia corymbosa var. corymbosa TaxID=529605 RepID=A0AAV1BYM3_OLDCO|nr:OLC1v1022783C1 [Oldenlandia corymbosa var. corymbosa]